MIFLLNLLLAISWMALTGQFDPLNFAIGFLLAYFMLRLVQNPLGSNAYFRRIELLVRFTLFYLKELFLANFRVALTVLSPKINISPAIVAVPLDSRSELSITLLANLITLTPGTLTLDISTDRDVMYVHTMHADDLNQFRMSIKELERRVLEVTE